MSKPFGRNNAGYGFTSGNFSFGGGPTPGFSGFGSPTPPSWTPPSSRGGMPGMSSFSPPNYGSPLGGLNAGYTGASGRSVVGGIGANRALNSVGIGIKWTW